MRDGATFWEWKKTRVSCEEWGGDDDTVLSQSSYVENTPNIPATDHGVDVSGEGPDTYRM